MSEYRGKQNTARNRIFFHAFPSSYINNFYHFASSQCLFRLDEINSGVFEYRCDKTEVDFVDKKIKL